MFGVGEWAPHPSANKAMVALLREKLTGIPVSIDVPSKYPDTFVVVERVGGDEQADGKVSNPMFAFQCYATGAGSAEDLAEQVLAVLKSAQFTRSGAVQFRKFELNGNIARFGNPVVTNRVRYQFTGSFSLS